MPDSSSSPSDAGLPDAVLERLAEQVHVRWMERRTAEGWRWGPVRDEAARTLPGLVPYDALTEAEKDYDRASAREAVGGLLALGYRLVAPEPLPSRPDAAGLPALFRLWSQHDREGWSGEAGRYVDFAGRALQRGDPLLAFEVVSEGLDAHPEHLRLRQLQALALARAGATERANTLLRGLLEADHPGPFELEETLGILARTHKDLAFQAATPGERREQLAEAHRLYHDAFRRTGGTYAGINAATLALLLGDVQGAGELAAEVRAIVVQAGSAEYYALATRAEAELLLGDPGEAERWYRRAAGAGAGRFGDLASTRRNARLILAATGHRLDLEQVLPLPQVGVLVSAEAAVPPDPAEQERLRRELDDWIARRGIGFGYASARADAELLFLEALRGQGAETHIVLPYSAEEHRRELPGPEAARFERALREAWEVCAATEDRPVRGDAFWRYADRLRLGLARMHAAGLDGEAHTLSLGPHAAAEAGAGDDGILLAGILFADVYRYSRLSDRQIPVFLEHFLGLVGRVARDHAPLFQNTWGDGLYFVFHDVRRAGLCALALNQQIAAVDWEAHGLPADLALRIGLHAGPVLRCTNPVTGGEEYTGKHTVRAARIEPVTPPGAVYASREFAALAAAEEVGEFACEPVGRVALAKRSATVPLFVLRPRGRADA